MSDDQKELQEILETEVVSNRVRPMTTDEMVYPPVGGTRGMGNSDYSQWMVGSNDTFRPSGTTRISLEPAVYMVDIDDRGLFFTKKKMITDSLVEMDGSSSQTVISNIRTFWESTERFKEHGILFKRGVLLWGPPGSGKTVTVTFLIRDLLNQGGLVLLCRSPRVTSIGLQELRRIEPTRALIVIYEDIEEIIEQHGEHDLLALLDGEHQVGNVVNIATTNYPERLGARIVNRPSRFDEVIKVGMPSDKARRRYLEHALKTGFSGNINTWVEDTKDMSIAHLRELVVATQCLGQPYEEAVKRLKHMKVVPNSGSGNGLGFSS